MIYKQVKFQDLTEKDGGVFGGIGAFEQTDAGDKLKFVICGCCGGVLEPEDVKIIQQYEYWINISQDILGDD